MDKSLFINNIQEITNPIKYLELFHKLLNICKNYFTHIYIVGSNFKLFQTVTNNRTEDPPGIYNIHHIYNNIKNYSLLLTLKNNDQEDNMSVYNVHVDYMSLLLDDTVDYQNFETMLKFRINIFFKNKNPFEYRKSVAILDLDDTLINKDGEIIIKDLHKYLETIRSLFNIVILWSHGCQSHVNYTFSNTMKPYKNYFTDKLARKSTFQLHNKGIGAILKHLNLTYNVHELDKTLLIDDQQLNYNKDYDYFIHVPKYSEYFSNRMWTLLDEVNKDMIKNNTI
ncbi:38K protein [Homarus gammarus nudivirus]|uniref:38K protein n=1 Tax=Homarus gammarus nudivirus TaxID=2509616 RepID=A0A411HB82_9VIRU|nr:38K protein [Homarus gammarus nudivirus]QBB28652.1 38K protein [Homarus gammarus nudivirus]